MYTHCVILTCGSTYILTGQVSVDVMFTKCCMLEEYMKTAIAPLGILFPFPLHFPKLESCMMTSVQLWDRFRCDGSLKAGIPNNPEFWQQEVLYYHYSDLNKDTFMFISGLMYISTILGN